MTTTARVLRLRNLHSAVQMIKAELVLWVAGFVLLSLIINAPLLPWVLRLTKLNVGKCVPHTLSSHVLSMGQMTCCTCG